MRALCLFSLLLFLYACDLGETEEVDCSAVSCAVDSMTLVLIDADGNNLIENGTYAREEIKVYVGGYERGGVPVNSEFDTVITIILSGDAGTVDYHIILNETEKDSLQLNLSILSDGGPCCPPDYEINAAFYNGTEQEIIRNETYPFEQLVVVK